jgi:hypothetical protein
VALASATAYGLQWRRSLQTSPPLSAQDPEKGLNVSRTTITRTLLTATLAVLGTATSASAATISNVSGPGGASATPPALNQTTSRTANTITFDVAGLNPGEKVRCRTDDLAWSDCASADGLGITYPAGPTPFSVGGHAVDIQAVDSSNVPLAGAGDDAFHRWRVEPVNYAGLIMGSGPYAYWKLDDAKGAPIAQDATANDFDGEYKNYVVQKRDAAVRCERRPHPPYACEYAANDAPGWSAYFGGRDDHVQLENVPNPPSGSWTIEAWVKSDSIGEERGIFQHVPALWITADDKFACAQLNHEHEAVVGGAVDPAKWQHVACKRSGGHLWLFVDGKLAASGPTTAPLDKHGAYQGFIGLTNKTEHLWFKGHVDNVAYYDGTVADDGFAHRWQIGTVDERWFATGFTPHSSPGGNLNVDVAPPSVGDIEVPGNNAQFSVDAKAFKHPQADFECRDPANPGPSSVVASCDAEVQEIDSAGNPVGAPTSVSDGDNLPLDGGTAYRFTITATDTDGFTWTHAHRYYVHGPSNGFGDLIRCTFGAYASLFACDQPIAYWRLDEAQNADTLVDAMGTHHGEFKNDQEGSSPNQGVSGGDPTANKTRKFFGKGGYAYVNGLDEPGYGYTMSLWVKPKDDEPMSLMQHGGSGALWIDDPSSAANDSVIKFRPEERDSTVLSSGAIKVTPNVWHHVVGTYDGVQAKLYVHKTPTSGPLPTFALADSAFVHFQPNGQDTLYLGYGTEAPWLRGELDEVSYYPLALGMAKLRQHFEADPPAGHGLCKQVAVSTKKATKKAKKKSTKKRKAKTSAKRRAAKKPAAKRKAAKVKTRTVCASSAQKKAAKKKAAAKKKPSAKRKRKKARR